MSELLAAARIECDGKTYRLGVRLGSDKISEKTQGYMIQAFIESFERSIHVLLDDGTYPPDLRDKILAIMLKNKGIL